MRRILPVGVLLFCAAAAAQADIAPPKGFKRVSVEHKVATEKAYPEYDFYSIIGRKKVDPVKLEPKSPAVLTGSVGSFRFVSLVAVPKDAAKKFGSEKEFHDALIAEKVAGQVQTRNTLNTLTTLKDGDRRTKVVEEYQLEKIDAKDGIVLKKTTKSSGPTSAPPKQGARPEEEDSPESAYAPRGGWWIAGLAGFAAIVLAGLWFARRTR